MELLVDEYELKKLLKKHNENLALKMEMQEIRELIFLDANKESIDKFISEDKSKKDENLLATLDAAVGIRPVVSS